MNGFEAQDLRLERIIEEQARLARRLDALAGEIRALQRQMTSGAAVQGRVVHCGAADGPPVVGGGTTNKPEPLSGATLSSPQPTALPNKAGLDSKQRSDATPPPLPPRDFSPPAAKAGASEPSKEGVEILVGKVWLVRMGVLLLVVALVLFANFAYQQVVSHLGPLAKWILLFAASVILGGAGTWLLRGEHMRRFGLALEAGGQAACFYLFFAAHHVEALRWIESPLVSGFVLLGWTAFMAWLADLRRSELLGGFSLLLAYTACMVTPVSAFGLFAVFALSAAAVFFLLKNGWSRVSMLALPATYGMFALWQVVLPAMEGSGKAVDASELALACLVGYWCVFAVAGFLSYAVALSKRQRAAWTLVNNTAVLLLGALRLLPVSDFELAFAWWACGLGVAWLALACHTTKCGVEQWAGAAQMYLSTGVIALSLGLAATLDGVNLAVAFAVETVALAALSRLQWRRLYLGLAVVAGAAAAVFESGHLIFEPGMGWSLLHGLMVFMALVAAGALAKQGKSRAMAGAVGLSLSAYWFCLLAVGVSLVLAIERCEGAVVALALLGLGALLSGSLPLHGFRELAHSSLAASFAGCLALVFTLDAGHLEAWHCVVAFILIATTGQSWLRFQGMGGGSFAGQAVLVLLAVAESAVMVVAGALARGSLHDAPVWAMAAFLLVAKARIFGSAWSGWLAALPLACASVVVIGHAFHGHGVWWADAMVVVAAAALRPLSLERKPLGNLPEKDHIIWRVFSKAMHPLAPAAAVLLAIAWSHACLPEERLTIAWSAGGVVLLVYGLMSRQAVHRLWGLGVLALAALRLIFVDLWALGPLARVVSVLVLGITLVAAGFLYNKFSDRLRNFIHP